MAASHPSKGGVSTKPADRYSAWALSMNGNVSNRTTR